MKAFGIRRIGAGAERIDLPDRAPGPGELRVKLAACGLNFADLLLAEGR